MTACEVEEWEVGPDAAAWSPPAPEPIPRLVRRQWNVSILVPAGADAERLWVAHITEALLLERCPKCLGPLLDIPPEFDDRPGWRLCRFRGYPDGWWKRIPTSAGGGYEWKLGMDPFTGEYVW